MKKTKALSFFLASALVSATGCGGSSDDEERPGCGLHGRFDAAVASCVCDRGYAGDACDSCATGWQGMESTGTCLPDCGGHGKANPAWDVLSETIPACLCDAGHGGELCDACAEGWQDNDGDGACAPGCGLLVQTSPCGGVNVCDDSSGTAECVQPHLENKAPWTVMVYLAADNNLGYYFDEDLGEVTHYAKGEFDELVRGMKAAGEKASNLNVIVLYDESADAPDPGTHVYRIGGDGAHELDTGNEIFVGEEADTSSEKTLMRFGVWTVANYPADRYALLLYDHGGGWKSGDGMRDGALACDGGAGIRPISRTEGDGGSGSGAGFRDFAIDETDGISIDLTTTSITLSDGAFAKAVQRIVDRAGKKLDLVGFNACLMGMYGVAKETAKVADYMVASPEAMMAYTGFAYDKLVADIAENPLIGPAELGRNMADGYSDAIAIVDSEEYESGVTIALYDLAKMPALESALDAFGKSLAAAARDSAQREVLAEIADDVQRYLYSEHADLRHLAQLAKERSDELPQGISALADSVIATLDDVLPYARIKSCEDFWGYGHDNASGMAIFFPQEAHCQYYATYPGMDIYYESPLLEIHGDAYTTTYYPCVHYPWPPTSASSYTLRDVKDYVRAQWSQGWGRFLVDYHQLDMGY